jgi:hypothetical protein
MGHMIQNGRKLATSQVCKTSIPGSNPGGASKFLNNLDLTYRVRAERV